MNMPDAEMRFADVLVRAGHTELKKIALRLKKGARGKSDVGMFQ